MNIIEQTTGFITDIYHLDGLVILFHHHCCWLSYLELLHACLYLKRTYQRDIKAAFTHFKTFLSSNQQQ